MSGHFTTLCMKGLKKQYDIAITTAKRLLFVYIIRRGKIKMQTVFSSSLRKNPNWKQEFFCCFDVFPVRPPKEFQVRAKISTLWPVFWSYLSVSFNCDIWKKYTSKILVWNNYPHNITILKIMEEVREGLLERLLPNLYFFQVFRYFLSLKAVLKVFALLKTGFSGVTPL